MTDPLLVVDPKELLLAPDEVPDGVVRVLLERAAAGSRPGARDDDHVVCLAIEGGGMRGAVSAGMCVALEAAGLTAAFDRVYGVSAGALNAAALAARQASLSATHYRDAAGERVISRVRPLLGRPFIDFDLLFGDIIAARKPLAFARLAEGPDVRMVATSLDTHQRRVLRDFADADELMQGIRASAALPMLGGRPPEFRGERMADGGLVESVPHETALDEGATHVLVLRSRPAGYRRPPLRGVAERVMMRFDPGMVELAHGRQAAYNREAEDLAERTARGDGRVVQVAVPDGVRLIGRLEASEQRVVEALGLGATAMANAILREPIGLCWQPVAHGALRPAAAPAETRPAPPPLRWSATARALRARA